MQLTTRRDGLESAQHEFTAPHVCAPMHLYPAGLRAPSRVAPRHLSHWQKRSERVEVFRTKPTPPSVTPFVVARRRELNSFIPNTILT